MKKKIAFEMFFLINIFIFIIANKPINCQTPDEPEKYEIHIYFEEIGNKILYCNDHLELNINENINFYKIDENYTKININSHIIQSSVEGFCEYPIKYEVTSIEEKIIIEISGKPKKLKQLFADSDISKIERFDYPYPQDESDMNGMFYHCTKLKYVDLSNFSFRNTKDLKNMFYSCSNLEEVIFPTDGNSNNIESFSDMFAFASKIQSIDLSSFNFKNTIDMGYMFNGCYNLKQIIFPKNDKAEKLEILSDMFANCKKLTSIDLSFFSFKKVINTSYMFNGCTELVSIIFPTEEKSNSLQFCKYMFCGCKKLKSIDISNLSFVKVIDISSMFNGCTNLETLILPQNENANRIEDFSHMFQGCTKLVEIDLSNIDFVNAKKLTSLFNSCSSLRTIELTTSAKAEKVENLESMFLYCESLISVDLSNFSFKKTRNLSAMFLYCINLETVILPKNEIATNIEDISYMFAICFKLKTIDLSGISFINLKDLSYSFSNCIALENLILPNDGEFNYIENIAYAFANCHKLTTIDLSRFNLENVIDLSYLFFSCITLENIIWPNTKMNQLQILDHMFDNCTAIETIDLSNSISLVSAINLDYAFSNCVNLKNFIISETEQNNNIITMNNTFSHNLALTSLDLSQIYISQSVNLNECFFNCPALKEINIWNLDISQSILTYNFLSGSYLEGVLYHSYDSRNEENYITIKRGSHYVGFHKCGPCINENENEYCTMNIEGENLDFYYIDYESNLPISERQCYWAKNYENVAGFTFMNNSYKGEISYYIDYCDNFCDECSENRKGCTKCKNHLYPIDIEYNDYLNGIQNYFFCYKINNLKHYYLNIITEQFTKCEEKCSECSNGPDICSTCNYEKGFYKVEGIDNECWKEPPSENYVLDKDEWRKCNDRCRKCFIQSKIQDNHQCLLCAENYYPYETDFSNKEAGAINAFNCYTIEEVKSDNPNYFLKDGLFKKCDESCAECEVNSNNCLQCQMNYYYIDGYQNGTCFEYPLKGYCPTQDILGNTVYRLCYKNCQLCHKVSQSFLYQQCKECDEDKFTLAQKSLNQSYCIPKINNNPYFINEDKKWYLSLDGMDELNNITLLYIDYQRLLQSDKYSEMDYIIVDECPSNLPYIIYETRQCVSSCNSSNLIEYGIFISKEYKLYQYQNICYIECPHGSFNDDITLTCKEKYKHTKAIDITQKSYELNRLENLLSYTGDETARETVEYIRGDSYSYYHHKVTYNNENIEKMKDSKMPIYFIDECINKLRIANNLNESEEIYIEIEENNEKDKILNSTSFKFFIRNGSILSINPCLNTEMIIMKTVNIETTQMLFIDDLKSLVHQSINISDTEKFLDRCLPIEINGKDITVQDRIKLMKKSLKLCDEGCSFIDFDRENNYSTCKCKISEEKEKRNSILDEGIEDLENIELIQGIILIIKDGNWRYLGCYATITKSGITKNGIMYIGIILFLVYCILVISFFLKDFKKIKDSLFLNAIRYLNQDDNDVIAYNDDNIFNDNEIEEDFDKAKTQNLGFNKTLILYMEKKIIIFNFCLKDKINSYFLKFIKLVIFIENYYFICGFLFTEKYISALKYIKNNPDYSMIIEKRRIILIIIVCYIMNIIIFHFFNLQEQAKNLEGTRNHEQNNQNDIEKEIYQEKIKFLTQFIIGFLLFFILNLIYIYFIMIFGTINSNSHSIFLLYLAISLGGYLVLYSLLILIIVSLRWFSINWNLKFIFLISNYIDVI